MNIKRLSMILLEFDGRSECGIFKDRRRLPSVKR